MVKITSDIYEIVNNKPILTLSHVFFGNTLERAQTIEQAHMKSDEFFRAAMTTGNYKGIKLIVDRYLGRE